MVRYSQKAVCWQRRLSWFKADNFLCFLNFFHTLRKWAFPTMVMQKKKKYKSCSLTVNVFLGGKGGLLFCFSSNHDNDDINSWSGQQNWKVRVCVGLCECVWACVKERSKQQNENRAKGGAGKWDTGCRDGVIGKEHDTAQKVPTCSSKPEADKENTAVPSVCPSP